MYIIRLLAADEEPREAATYDLEMAWVPLAGDIIVINHTGRSELRYRVKGRTRGEPIVSLDVQRLEATTALFPAG